MSIPKPTRERILEAARALLETRGAGVRVEDIAAEAKVSRQAVYLHFGTRGNLLIETARYVDAQESLPERVRPYREAPTALESLRRWVEFWANYIPVVYPVARALLAERDGDAAAAAAWEDRMAAVRGGCALVADRLASEGALDGQWSREDAAGLMFGTVSIRSWEVYTREIGWAQDRYVSTMTEVLLRILTPAAAR